MRRFIDITGQTFGRLTVVKHFGENKHKSTLWLCKCVCGNEKAILGAHLRSGVTKSCGCTQYALNNGGRKPKDLTGQRFGKLVVIEKSGILDEIRRTNHQWKCKCDCGKEIITDTGRLTGNQIKSCGCFDFHIQDLIGKRFGKLLVTEKLPPNTVGTTRWLCKCDCGKHKRWSGPQLLKGIVSSCGCDWKSFLPNTKASNKAQYYKCIPLTYLKQVEHGARVRGIGFSLPVEDAYEVYEKQQGKCVLSGIPLTFHHKDSKLKLASLDRIDSSVPYTKENVQWLHKHINHMKADFTQSEFIEYCKLVASHNIKQV
jgi:hypothetical protein